MNASLRNRLEELQADVKPTIVDMELSSKKTATTTEAKSTGGNGIKNGRSQMVPSVKEEDDNMKNLSSDLKDYLKQSAGKNSFMF